MMNTPTWRSQRPGPAVTDDSGSHSPIGHGDYAPSSSNQKENEFDGNHVSDYTERRLQKSQDVDDNVQLGHDGKVMSILGIHPFLKASENPESLVDTFLISAAVCGEADSPNHAVHGEIHPFRFPTRRTGIHSKSAEDQDFPENPGEDDYMCNYKEIDQSSPESVSDSPGPARARKQKNDEENMSRQEVDKEKARDIHELMERDVAIESVNFEHVSPRRQRPATPEEERRFKCLLGRLKPQRSGEQMENPTLVDPAIISFAPKKQGMCHGVDNLMTQLWAAEKQYQEENREHVRSDSGYTSPTTYSRPSTRARSRSRQDTSDDATAGNLSIQHQKFGSKDSGFDSSPKHSILNPAAKEFSAINIGPDFQTKEGRLARPPVSEQFYSSPQHFPGSNSCFKPAKPDAAFQSPRLGFDGQPNHITGPMNFATTPGLAQVHPRILPQITNFSNTSLPPPPGFGFLGNLPTLGGAPGPNSGISHPLGMGMPVITPTPGLASTPGFASAGLVGPFHHQLPITASCNNPAHQSISPFNPAHVSPVPAITPLPPPAPPASLMPQITTTQLPTSTAPAVPAAVPFIRKTVPKPKVPNTTGQQYWEYVHEMRRTYEPGYAQKSKANQQKRFMKQVHKGGDTAGQS